MASHNISKQNKELALPALRKTEGSGIEGFTLIEVLVALGILAVCFSLGLFISFDFYKSYSFNLERGIIVSSLQKARNQSLNNINQVRHGVHFQANPSLEYIIFECPQANPQCNDYAANPNDIVIGSSYGISFIGPTPALPFNIIFDQLSGDCVNCQDPKTTLAVSSEARSYDININKEGGIDW